MAIMGIKGRQGCSNMSKSVFQMWKDGYGYMPTCKRKD
jgi:hypothetical protein